MTQYYFWVCVLAMIGPIGLAYQFWAMKLPFRKFWCPAALGYLAIISTHPRPRVVFFGLYSLSLIWVMLTDDPDGWLSRLQRKLSASLTQVQERVLNRQQREAFR